MLLSSLGYGKIIKKILLTSWVVKGKYGFGNSLDFPAQIEDLQLKCCIFWEESKNKTSGRKKCGLFSQKTTPKFLIGGLPSPKRSVAFHPLLMEGLVFSGKPSFTWMENV